MSSSGETVSTPGRFPLLRDPTPGWKAIVAVGMYVGWTGLTWVLEGRIQTLLRPEAVLDRLVYKGVANVLVGTILALILVREFVATGFLSRAELGFRSVQRTLLSVLVGGAFGFAIFAVRGPPTTDPIVVVNVFAQVLPVSIAEVIVCWVVVGGSVAAFLRRRGLQDYIATGIALVLSSVLFGVYHIAHSPPFNTVGMVVLLTIVGFGTGLVYFVGHTFYGALAFHNVLALVGVVSSLATAGQLEPYRQPLLPLLVTALVSLSIVIAMERLFVRGPGPSSAVDSRPG